MEVNETDEGVFVIPAQAGIQSALIVDWIPACAGMTGGAWKRVGAASWAHSVEGNDIHNTTTANKHRQHGALAPEKS